VPKNVGPLKHVLSFNHEQSAVAQWVRPAVHLLTFDMYGGRDEPAAATYQLQETAAPAGLGTTYNREAGFTILCLIRPPSSVKQDKVLLGTHGIQSQLARSVSR
jgi:hypothetical protein